MKPVTTLITFLTLLAPLVVTAAPITYYNSDFEDGSLGGAVSFGGSFGTPTNIFSSNLDGRALEFDLNDQILWSRGAAPESSLHYVAFDFWAEQDANVTQFLDVPSILRLDVSLSGRHHLDIYYDLANQSIESYLDGVLNNSLINITAWPFSPVSSTVRIGNQEIGPGYSDGKFQIDNFIWQGNVARTVPEPLTLALMGVGLVGIGYTRRRRNKN